MSNYPEHEKLKAISKESQTCGEFLEWAEGKSYIIRNWRKRASLTTMLAQYFEIDEEKLAAEKDAMLEEQRKLNARSAR